MRRKKSRLYNQAGLGSCAPLWIGSWRILGKTHVSSELLFSHLENAATNIRPSGIAMRSRIWKLPMQILCIVS